MGAYEPAPSIQLSLEHSNTVSHSERFRHLFEVAPVCLLEEDYTAAVAALVDVVLDGVDDVERYLLEHPDLLRSMISKVHIVDVNPAALHMFGLDDPSQLTGPIKPSTLNDAALVSFAQQLAAIARGELRWESTFRGSDMEGTELPISMSLHIPTQDGRPDFCHVMVSMTDVTELLDTQKRLEGLIRWKDQFTASVAHELRTPVTGIVGFAELIRSGASTMDAESISEMADILAGEARELERLVEDLLVASRAEAGQLEVHVAPVALKPLVDDAVKLVDAEVAVVGNDHQVLADTVRVRQIVRNLLTNAIRYGGPSRQIEIGTGDATAFVDVMDDGPAIPAQIATEIFEPFSRGSSKQVESSVGLGLAVSRSLAEAQNGTLEYRRVDERNVFRLTLPLSAQ